MKAERFSMVFLAVLTVTGAMLWFQRIGSQDLPLPRQTQDSTQSRKTQNVSRSDQIQDFTRHGRTSLAENAVQPGQISIEEVPWNEPFPPARYETVADTAGNKLIGKPAAAPTISKEQAFEKARTTVMPAILANSTGMRDCREEFAAAGALDANGDLGDKVPDINTDRCKKAFDNIPAWVITFQGLEIPFGGVPGDKPSYNHEMNVVIDARTGEKIHYFTYR